MKSRWKPVALILAALMIIAGFVIYSNIQHPAFLKSSIDSSKVSEIEIFDGNTGKRYKITEQSSIEHIVNNLNSITFVKDKSSKNYSGFSFNTTIKDKDGDSIWNGTINSSDTIIYNEYFYIDKSSSVDYNYIKNLLASKTPIN